MLESNWRGSVSVVTGVYNSGRWIRQALDSVLAQTYPVREIIVVDDGSTDDTAGIAASYGGIVKYMREEHRGRPQRNRGVAAASGEFVAFIDGDDYWEPQKLERQLAQLIQRRLSWAICEAKWMDAGGGSIAGVSGSPLQDGDILESLLLHNFIVASTVVVAKSVLDECGYFDEGPEVAAVEDWDLWLRIAARHAVAGVREPLCALRLHGDSFLSGLPTAERVRHLETVIGRAVHREPSRLKPRRRRALANVSYAAGVQCFRSLRLDEARRYFLIALKRRPTSASALVYIVLTLLGPGVCRAVLGMKRRAIPHAG